MTFADSSAEPFNVLIVGGGGGDERQALQVAIFDVLNQAVQQLIQSRVVDRKRMLKARLPEPAPFHPVIHGILLTGGKPRYLSAHVTGGHGSSSQITEAPTWSPATKIAAKYLAPYLEKHDRLARSNA